jgi:hypothetical protein
MVNIPPVTFNQTASWDFLIISDQIEPTLALTWRVDAKASVTAAIPNGAII